MVENNRQRSSDLGIIGNLIATLLVSGGSSAGIKYLGRFTGLNFASDLWNALSALVFLVLFVALTLIQRGTRVLILTAVRRLRYPRAQGDRLAIAIATLSNDVERHIAHHIELSLAEVFGGRVEIVPCEETIVLGKRGNLEDRQMAGALSAQEIAAKANAHLVIWGQALRQEKIVDLYFTARGHNDGSVHSYLLTPTLRLPENFGTELGTAIAAIAASSAAPAYDGGKYAVDLLRPVISQLQRLAGSPPASLDGDTRAQLYLSYASSLTLLGEQDRDEVSLEKAVYYYRQALRADPRSLDSC
ncbi:MAG: hypothetical protein WDM86_08255 [Rhizomicrobium sp.]